MHPSGYILSPTYNYFLLKQPVLQSVTDRQTKPIRPTHTTQLELPNSPQNIRTLPNHNKILDNPIVNFTQTDEAEGMIYQDNTSETSHQDLNELNEDSNYIVQIEDHRQQAQQIRSQNLQKVENKVNISQQMLSTPNPKQKFQFISTTETQLADETHFELHKDYVLANQYIQQGKKDASQFQQESDLKNIKYFTGYFRGLKLFATNVNKQKSKQINEEMSFKKRVILNFESYEQRGYILKEKIPQNQNQLKNQDFTKIQFKKPTRLYPINAEFNSTLKQLSDRYVKLEQMPIFSSKLQDLQFTLFEVCQKLQIENAKREQEQSHSVEFVRQSKIIADQQKSVAEHKKEQIRVRQRWLDSRSQKLANALSVLENQLFFDRVESQQEIVSLVEHEIEQPKEMKRQVSVIQMTVPEQNLPLMKKVIKPSQILKYRMQPLQYLTEQIISRRQMQDQSSSTKSFYVQDQDDEQKNPKYEINTKSVIDISEFANQNQQTPLNFQKELREFRVQKYNSSNQIQNTQQENQAKKRNQSLGSIQLPNINNPSLNNSEVRPDSKMTKNVYDISSYLTLTKNQTLTVGDNIYIDKQKQRLNQLTNRLKMNQQRHNSMLYYIQSNRL